MTDRWHYFILTVIVLMVLIMSSCASNTPKQRTFTGHLIVAPNANPDHQGRPSPIIVKIYQLKEVSAFQESDFFSLFDEGRAILSGDLISVEERELQPGISYDYTADVDPATTYIAMIAAFRDIEKARWRVVVKLPEKDFFDFIKNRILQVNVSDLSVSAAFIER
ncbi:MAG: type VI secretion system lipoprotein TssJ [Gammaproteobacteria bacterium]|nr:type VI secretion system lipoprotein TssJ [Gammaproteobacteria bacterium]